MRGTASFLAIALAASLLAPAQARACTRPAPLEFDIDTRARGLRPPPPPPTGVTATASRSSASFCGSDGLCTASTCASAGTLRLEFDAPSERAPNQLAYRLQLLDGQVPTALQQPISAIIPGAPPLHIELPFDPIPDLDATFQLLAIDHDGNESQPSEPFPVTFDGCTTAAGLEGCVEDTGGRVTCTAGACIETAAEGCALSARTPGAGGGFALGVLGLLGVLGVLRRRR